MKVHFIGDSLTVGLYASADNAFRQVLMARLAAAFTSYTWTWTVGNGYHIADELIAGTGTGCNTINPNIVVSEIGIHDAAGDIDVGDFVTDYTTLLNQITANGHDPLICIVGLWLRDDFAHGTDYETALKSFASTWGVYADTNAIWQDSSNYGPVGLGPYTYYETGGYYSDNWHPNTAGHNLIANAIYNAISLRKPVQDMQQTGISPVYRGVSVCGHVTPIAPDTFENTGNELLLLKNYVDNCAAHEITVTSTDTLTHKDYTLTCLPERGTIIGPYPLDDYGVFPTIEYDNTILYVSVLKDTPSA